MHNKIILDKMEKTNKITPSIKIDVLKNDINAEDCNVALESNPIHGDAELNSDNTVTYTLNNLDAPSDAFTYSLNDKEGKELYLTDTEGKKVKNEATVYINIRNSQNTEYLKGKKQGTFDCKSDNFGLKKYDTREKMLALQTQFRDGYLDAGENFGCIIPPKAESFTRDIRFYMGEKWAQFKRGVWGDFRLSPGDYEDWKIILVTEPKYGEVYTELYDERFGYDFKGIIPNTSKNDYGLEEKLRYWDRKMKLPLPTESLKLNDLWDFFRFKLVGRGVESNIGRIDLRIRFHK